jgi:hypothetical protein
VSFRYAEIGEVSTRCERDEPEWSDALVEKMNGDPGAVEVLLGHIVGGGTRTAIIQRMDRMERVLHLDVMTLYRPSMMPALDEARRYVAVLRSGADLFKDGKRTW